MSNAYEKIDVLVLKKYGKRIEDMDPVEALMASTYAGMDSRSEKATEKESDIWRVVELALFARYCEESREEIEECIQRELSTRGYTAK